MVSRSLAVLWLTPREPAFRVAVYLGLAGLLLVPLGNAIAYSIWMALPIFLTAVAFVMPVSRYLAPLPIPESRVILARLLAVLAMVWLPIATGIAVVLLWPAPWGNVPRAVEFAALLTAAVLLLWTAVESVSRAWKRSAVLAAAVAALGSTALLPWAFVIAAIPTAITTGLVLVPFERMRIGSRDRVPHGWRWMLLQSSFSLSQTGGVFISVFVGSNPAMMLTPLLAYFLTPKKITNPWLQHLPVPRRVLLWTMLLPVLIPFLASLAFFYYYRMPTRHSDFGVPVPLDYYVYAPGPIAPEIRAPWGEVAHPPTQPVVRPFAGNQYIYNPYWSDADSSPQFVQWQFGRQVREIYGKEMSSEESVTALYHLRPVALQPRMAILTLTFRAGVVLLIALVVTVVEAFKLRRIGPFVRVAAQGLVILTVFSSWWLPYKTFFGGDALGGIVQGWLLRLSPKLPSNNLVMGAVALAALAPLYFTLEKAFKYVEIPDKEHQETA